MSFDWEAFVKHGFVPAAQNVAQWLGADLESRLSRQSHGQRMLEKEFGHSLQSDEMRQKFAHDVFLKQMDKDLEATRDIYARNRIVLSHTQTREDETHKAALKTKATEEEELIKFGYKKKQYEAMRDILGYVRKTEPEKFDEISLNSITKSTNSLSKLQDMENKLLERHKELVGELAQYQAAAAEGGQAPPEAKAIQDSIAYIQRKQLPTIYKMRSAIENQINQFNTVGITSKGIVQPDKQELLKRHLGILEDKLHYMGKSMGDLPGEALLQALNASLHDEDQPIQIEPADVQFLLSQIARSAASAFKTKKK